VNSYLPYFDLKLFAAGHRSDISSATLQTKLDVPGALPWDATRTAAGSLEVFNADTVAAMRLESRGT
jgi:hypothetical protein